MKSNKNNKSLFFFIFLFFFSPMTEARSSNSTQSVSVEVELEEMPDARTYEIEIKKITGKKEKRLDFTQKDAVFKIKLAVGNYQVRTRIISSQAQVGPWSEWSELLARPEEVASVNLASNNISVNKKQTAAAVDLKWPKANGAEKYVIWIEDQVNKTVIRESSKLNNIKLNLKLGEYKIGVQSISKEGIISQIKYAENSVFVARTHLPQIELTQSTPKTFSWKKQNESDVKIEIYRRSFFGDKFLRVQTLKAGGESWRLPHDLQPGEYKINFQYVSDNFENGPIRTISFLKKPDEKDFSRATK